MLLSKTCTYAIRAILLVAHKEMHEGRTYVSARELARELRLSSHFLAKILQGLIKAKILMSYRCPNGGVSLAGPPADLRLIDIVAATDGLHVFEECLLGLPQCNPRNPCPLHQQWAGKRDGLRKMFERATVGGMARRNNLRNLRSQL
jgi:Rrf2 family protein